MTAAKSRAPRGAAESPSEAFPVGAVDMQEMLERIPEMAQQLRQLGWAPPRLDIATSSSGFTPDLETLLAAPNTVSADILSRLASIYPF